MSPNKFPCARLFHGIRLIALASLFLVICSRASAETKAGDAFPSLDPSALEGGQIPLTAGRVVLIDFWASWCAPCRESFPSYAQLQSDYAARGLTIVAISVDQSASAFAAFVKKLHPPFATLRDKDHHLVQQVDVPLMPTCYLVGRDGRVHSIHAGFHGATTERDLRHEIDSLLAESSPAS